MSTRIRDRYLSGRVKISPVKKIIIVLFCHGDCFVVHYNHWIIFHCTKDNTESMLTMKPSYSPPVGYNVHAYKRSVSFWQSQDISGQKDNYCIVHLL
jgi:hypothetical protein